MQSYCVFSNDTTVNLFFVTVARESYSDLLGTCEFLINLHEGGEIYHVEFNRLTGDCERVGSLTFTNTTSFFEE